MKKVRTFLCAFGFLTMLTGAISLAQDTATVDMAETDDSWTICNDTSFILRVATAHAVNGQLTPKGWIRVRPGDCHDTEITPTIDRFVYAESSVAHQGGVREWKGGVTLCASDDDFEADITKACPLQGMETRSYMRVAQDDPVTRFVEPTNYAGSAYTAGLQRLLRDNGYPISRIDGLAGRRTSQTLSSFLTDNELSSDLSAEAQIDALEKAALEFTQSIGLTVCNGSSRKIWAAIGHRRKGNWVSRGWWAIDNDKCSQIFRETLDGRELHYFVLQEGAVSNGGILPEPDKHLISNAPQPAQFCTAESRFTALGRENCADYGYNIADFRVVPTDNSGYSITLTDADFSTPSTVGLRR